MTEIFIGVVSHASSRFLGNTGPQGLARRLARRLSGPTTQVAVLVNTENAWSPEILEITDELVAESHAAQREVEARWQRYLGGHAIRQLRKTVELFARRARRTDPQVGRRGIERLLNIELSHRALLQAGVASGADWILILEDDGGSTDPEECALGLAALLEAAGAQGVAYINLSESFTPRQLGIDHLLTEIPSVPWVGGVQRQVLAAERPVTNTVCAIAYRARFARMLCARLDSSPLSPVVAIDWKLNELLMAMHSDGVLGAGDCWLVEPAPIAQLSMHADRQSPAS